MKKPIDKKKLKNTTLDDIMVLPVDAVVEVGIRAVGAVISNPPSFSSTQKVAETLDSAPAALSDFAGGTFETGGALEKTGDFLTGGSFEASGSFDGLLGGATELSSTLFANITDNIGGAISGSIDVAGDILVGAGDVAGNLAEGAAEILGEVIGGILS